MFKSYIFSCSTNSVFIKYLRNSICYVSNIRHLKINLISYNTKIITQPSPTIFPELGHDYYRT